MPAANAETMSLHLTAIGRKVAAGSHAVLILDGAGYHIAAALTIPENVTLVRLPPYAPELNPIENVWEFCAATNSRSPSSTTTTISLMKLATHGTCLNKIQTASPQSPPEHGQQSMTRRKLQARGSVNH
jgi:transposase